MGGSYFTENSSNRYLLLRIIGNTLKVFIKGVEVVSKSLPTNITLRPDRIKIGGFHGNIWNYALWHRAGTGTPEIPSEPSPATLNVNHLSGFGTGADGDMKLSKKADNFNCCGLIFRVKDERTFEVYSWLGGGSGVYAEQGCEVMIHVTKPRRNEVDEWPYLGMYAFRKIARLKETIDGIQVILNRSIREETGGFTLNAELVADYYVQAIVVPNFRTFTQNSKYIYPVKWQDYECGGIVVFRTTGDCTLNSNITTRDYGGIRAYDNHKLSHHALLDRFLCSRGGGVMILCGGKLTVKSSCIMGGVAKVSTWYGKEGTKPGMDYLPNPELPNHTATNCNSGGTCVILVARSASIGNQTIKTGTNTVGGGGFCYMAIGELVDG